MLEDGTCEDCVLPKVPSPDGKYCMLPFVEEEEEEEEKIECKGNEITL